MKYFNLNNLYTYFYSFFSLVKINFIIYFKQKKNNKIKIVFFYFPVKAYQANMLELIKKLSKKKNLLIILAYNKHSSLGLKNEKNSILLDFGYLRFIPYSMLMLSKIDLFLSSYLTYIYPPNSTNIYINHDIADTPIVNRKIEKIIFQSLLKLDYIFLSSETVVKYFNSKFTKFNLNNKNNLPKLINTGYIKLDHVIKKLLNFKNKKNNSILLAPTYSRQMQQYNISKNLIKIINYLLIMTNFKIIYRPHPLDLTKKGNNKLVHKIKKKFFNKKNFSMEFSSSYLNSYSRAKFLITDFSGTAYTFAFSTLRPIIFFSRNEKKLIKSEYSNLIYFKDRLNVGFISENTKNILKIIKKINKNSDKFKSKIYDLRKKRIKYLNNSLIRTHNYILQILKKKIAL